MWLAFHLLLVFLTVLRVLSRDQLSPIIRLAWFLVLIIVPLIGVVLYFLFGEVNLGKKANLDHVGIMKQIRALGSSVLGNQSFLVGSVEKTYHPAFHYAASINGFATTLGNRADLMPDANTARAQMIVDIDNAKSQVHVLYYIWLNDQTGTDVAKALIRAAKRGITCRAMADGLGSRVMIHSALWKEMQEAGVNVSVALPFNHFIKTLILSRFDLRNHRKITVIDGHITYCGSQNCADPEFRVKPQFAPWVDIMLRVEGPVVAHNQLLFASDWMLNEETTLAEFELKSDPLDHGFPAQIWGDGPTERRSATPHMFSTLLNTAQYCITISTPYFVPSESVLEAICSAAIRGIKVTIIFPARNDSWIVRATSQSYYHQLLEAGVNIHEYSGGLLHAKTLTIDGVITLLGSSNMDLRSFDLNYENNILLSDESVTRSICQRQSDYLQSSHPISLAAVNNWSLPKRMWNNVIATIGPVL